MRQCNIMAVAIAGLCLALPIGVAQADETTTTTTTQRSDPPPAPGITVGVPGVVGVHIGGDGQPDGGCSTTKTTHTNDDTGNSVTRKTTNCGD